jgi:alkylhydroperoxidase family enzyme
LAILTVAEGVRCDFVVAQHVPISRDAGVDDATRELIKNGDHTDPALSKRDRAVIQFAARSRNCKERTAGGCRTAGEQAAIE